MDLELGSNVGVDVAILALVPILWVRMQRWNQIRSKYRKGVTMTGAILLLVHVVLCIRELKKSHYYTKIYQLGLKIMERVALLAFAVLFMVVGRACWRSRKHKSFKKATMIMGAIITLVFVVIFMRKSTIRNVPEKKAWTYPSKPLPKETLVRDKKVYYIDNSYLYKKQPMPLMSYKSCRSSPFVSSIVRSKTFDIRKITTKIFFFLFVAICASIGT